MNIEEFLTPDRVAMLMWMLSAAVQAMPSPNGNKLYTFVYRFSHLVAANIRVSAKDHKPEKSQREVWMEAQIAELQAKLDSFTAVKKNLASDGFRK